MVGLSNISIPFKGEFRYTQLAITFCLFIRVEQNNEPKNNRGYG